MAFLCISLNNSSVNTVHILDGELLDIDKYTSEHNNSKEILKEYPEKIKELKNIYNLEEIDAQIKLQIFLPNDKEEFIMYKKHLVASRYLIKQIEFMAYAIGYETNLFNKNIREKILDENMDIDAKKQVIDNYMSNLSEEEFYKTVRIICQQYDNYLEDYSDKKLPSIDKINKAYLENITLSKIRPTNKKDPFMVFKHPNFFKVYGRAIDKDKPVIILGDSVKDSNKAEYKELYDNCTKCFSNDIYCPLNYNLLSPLDKELASLINNSLLMIVNGNGTSEEFIKKINYACSKNITILLLTKDKNLFNLYTNYYNNYQDNVIIKMYEFNDYDSMKLFSDIVAGFYINKYKSLKVGV